ncbi:MAG TPA: hypothetical protein VH186_10445 [Chloroflexia bacterium]|nr:hypothetical protein [Chloroflexia bacterium]
MAQEYYPLLFNEEGYPVKPGYGQAILETLVKANPPVTDVWVLAHGWNNDLNEGQQTYHDWINTFRPVIEKETAGTGYNPLFVGLHWPSKAWAGDIAKASLKLQPAKKPAGPVTGGGEGEFEIGEALSQSAAEDRKGQARFVEDYRHVMDPESIHGERFDHDFSRLYHLMKQEKPPTRAEIEEFVKILKLYTTRDPHSDPTEKGNVLSAPVSLLTRQLEAQAQALPGQSQNLEGFFKLDTLLEFFRTFTFWKMKGRAAIVGETGVYPFLLSLRDTINQNNLATRIHLLGHSFGAKLVTASIYPAAGAGNVALPLVNTVILLQGAFSQFAFSSMIPVESHAAGRYAAIVERGVITNPVVVIYSKYDTANTICYPAGMALAAPISSKIYEKGGPADDESLESYQISTNKFGAIGANGAQGLPEARNRTLDMQSEDQPYQWSNLAGVYCLNVDGQHYIKAGSPPAGAHSDILHPEIYHLALAMSLR